MTFEASGEQYDRFVGRYLPELGAAFADAAGVRPGQRAVDIGCGPGGLTRELVARLGAESVTALDPSASFVVACRERNPGVDVRLGIAEQLPFADRLFDVALASLVVPFMQDPVRGVREMARVASVVAACVWDYGEGMEMLRVFWEAAAAVDPDAPGEKGLIGGSAGDLGRIFGEAGLGRIEESALDVGAEYADFDDWWEPFTYGIGPAGSYCVSLDEEHRAALREECRRRLGDPQAPFRAPARAWYAVGTA
jgi:SAM-dependent methyltransferase